MEGRPGILLEISTPWPASGTPSATPKLNWDAILTDFPVLFSVRDPRRVRRTRQISGKGRTQIIGANPSILLSTQRGDDMISYDNGSLRQAWATVAGDGTSDG